VLINIHKQLCSPGQGYSVTKSKVHRRLNFALRVLGTASLVVCMCTSAAKPASPRRVEVTAKRFAFEPAEITLKKGEAVDFVLTSSDVDHGIRIRELHLDLRAAKGKSSDVTLTPTTTGTFVGHCSVFCGSGHGKMTLTIHVVA
jgi:cytochrome c oxidase subunit II